MRQVKCHLYLSIVDGKKDMVIDLIPSRRELHSPRQRIRTSFYIFQN